MGAGDLPRGRDLERSVMLIPTVLGFATAALVIGFLVPVIQLSPGQLRLTAVCGGIAAVLFTVLGNRLQTP